MDSSSINGITSGSACYRQPTMAKVEAEPVLYSTTDAFTSGQTPQLPPKPTTIDMKKAAQVLLNGDVSEVVPKKLWSFDVGRNISAPVKGPDGTLFIASEAGKLHAVDPTTGKEKWAREFSSKSEPFVAVTSKNTVIITNSEGKAEAFDGTTGESKWKHESLKKLTVYPGAGPDGIVVLASRDNTVLGLDEATGTQKWSYSLTSPPEAPPVTSDDGTVIVGCSQYMGGTTYGELTGINGSTGKFKWGNRFTEGMKSRMEIAPGNLLLTGGEDWNVHAFDASKGTKKWDKGAGYWVRSSPTANKEGTMVFAASFDEKLRAFDAQKGEKKWEIDLDLATAPSPVAGDENMLFVAGKDNKLLVLNQETGKQMGEYQADAMLRNKPVYNGSDTLYVTTADGKLQALQVKTRAKELEELKKESGEGKQPPLDEPRVEKNPYGVDVDGVQLRKRWPKMRG